MLTSMTVYEHSLFDCVWQASKLDRYLQIAARNKRLQGSGIHNYRENYKPTIDSYDAQNSSKHTLRLLLKAEPQSGKTGDNRCLAHVHSSNTACEVPYTYLHTSLQTSHLPPSVGVHMYPAMSGRLPVTVTKYVLAGAYIGFLLQLRRLLEPSCSPVTAPQPVLSKQPVPHPVYGQASSALRWAHPFYEDIRTSKFPDYEQVQPSKYARKVASLLAPSCDTVRNSNASPAV